YCLQDRDTPQWEKATIVGALGYFIFPADGIPDAIPVIGFSDDLVVITAALGIVVMHIKLEHRQQAEEKLKTWFG
ncbi:MAG: YkvA family protein, partial [Chloroflexi bacterium]|nr:YkvA family protein [Chloroflexota bacterium]